MYSGTLPNKVEGHTMDIVESKPQRMLSWPIGKFQTEILPPKSAKSIPITHHKLMSPIKSHGYIPTKNAAHIMEAAAKIIEPTPQANIRTKMPAVGSSSVPLKVRDLKEKVEASQKMPLVGSYSVPLKVRDLKEKLEASHKTSKVAEASRRPVESNAAKYLKEHSLKKSWNGSVDSKSFRASDVEEGTSGVKNKGKSISLAIQATVNVQRRGLNSSSNQSLVTQKEQSEVKSSQPFKNQPTLQKNSHKKCSTNNPSGVLTQTNQKQNCVTDKDKLSSKPVSSLQDRKMLSEDSSTVQQKPLRQTAGNSKIGSRKLDSDVMVIEKGVSYSDSKNVPRKKRSIDRDLQYETNQAVEFRNKNQKSIQFNSVIDRDFTLSDCNSKQGMDVVSFVFTAPLTGSMPGSENSCRLEQQNDTVCADDRDKRLMLDTDSMNLSSLGYNVIEPEALSMLLEQKLRELSYRADSFKMGSSSRSASILPDQVPIPNAIGTGSRFQDKGNQHEQLTDKLGNHYESEFSFTDPPVRGSKHKFQRVDEMDKCSTNHLDGRQLFDCRHSSSVSILEPSLSAESCNSSDSVDSSSTDGNKQISSVQAQEVLGLSSLKKFHLLEVDTELSDSVSSASSGNVAKTNAITVIATDSAGQPSGNWNM